MSGMFAYLNAYRRLDPAAKSSFEVLLLYPGVKAMGLHRLAHGLYAMGLYLAARAISEFSRGLTGIEIHPGARIGKRVVIDHGFGVVIGETAVVGDDVLIYQGVTLGGASREPGKRHPTVGDRVLLGAGSKVLGNITVGADARVGANAVVVNDVPAGAVIVGVPGRVAPKGTITHYYDDYQI